MHDTICTRDITQVRQPRDDRRRTAEHCNCETLKPYKQWTPAPASEPRRAAASEEREWGVARRGEANRRSRRGGAAWAAARRRRPEKQQAAGRASRRRGRRRGAAGGGGGGARRRRRRRTSSTRRPWRPVGAGALLSSPSPSRRFWIRAEKRERERERKFAWRLRMAEWRRRKGKEGMTCWGRKPKEEGGNLRFSGPWWCCTQRSWLLHAPRMNGPDCICLRALWFVWKVEKLEDLNHMKNISMEAFEINDWILSYLFKFVCNG